MRLRSMLMALIVVASAGRASAGTLYTFDFSTLAADAGQVVPIAEFEAGPFTAYFYNVLVIGPDDPGYAGQIGILPTSGYFLYLADFQGGSLEPFLVNSVSAVFAPGDSTDLAVGALGGGGYPAWMWSSTLSGPTTEVFTPYPSPTYFGLLDLYRVDGNGAQMLSLTIDDPPPPPPPGVPEPTSALLLSLSCATLGLIGIVRRRRGRRARVRRGPGGRSKMSSSGAPPHIRSSSSGRISMRDMEPLASDSSAGELEQRGKLETRRRTPPRFAPQGRRSA